MRSFISGRANRVLAGVGIITAIIWIFALWPHKERLSVTFLDVGQGDSAVIRSPHGKVVLVDAGGVPKESPGYFDTGKRIVTPYLHRHGIGKIDLVIATHPHEDHIGGLNSILRELPVKALLDSGTGLGTPSHTELLDYLKQQKVRLIQAKAGMKIAVDKETSILILNPSAKHFVHEDANECSIAFLLQYKGVMMIFAADCGEDAEMQMLQRFGDLRCNVLKVGHHGSSRSCSSTWLSHISPDAAIISVGRDNQFNLPSRETLDRLKAFGCRIYRTDLNGAITISTDGKTLKVSAGRAGNIR